MKKIKSCTLAVVLVATVGGTQSILAVETSANVALVSDYLFRGVSQTDEKGAIQGGFDFTYESGFYAGIWASNVNYGTDTSTEMDFYGGYGWSAGESEFDVGFIYYDYEGDAEFDYQELSFAYTRGDLTLGVYYSPEYLGDNGPRMIHPYVDYGMAINESLNLSLHLGMTDLDEEGLFEVGEDSYMDYSIGLSWTAGGIDMSAVYTNTTIDDLEAAEGRVVFSFSKEL